jgi:hypothetical protein
MLEPPIPAGHDQVGVLKHLEVLHHSEPRHAEPFLELGERQSAPVAQGIEQSASGGIGQRLEHVIHGHDDR